MMHIPKLVYQVLSTLGKLKCPEVSGDEDLAHLTNEQLLWSETALRRLAWRQFARVGKMHNQRPALATR